MKAIANDKKHQRTIWDVLEKRSFDGHDKQYLKDRLEDYATG